MLHGLFFKKDMLEVGSVVCVTWCVLKRLVAWAQVIMGISKHGVPLSFIHSVLDVLDSIGLCTSPHLGCSTIVSLPILGLKNHHPWEGKKENWGEGTSILGFQSYLKHILHKTSHIVHH
jgi:hypothetical protein